jgi:hypothetical protein
MIVCILGYNYFFGDSAEKENARKIVGQGKEVLGSVRDLVRSEREKYDRGKYDTAIDKVGNVFDKIRSTAHDNRDILDELDRLEVKRKKLQSDLRDIEAAANDEPGTAKESEFTERGGKTTTMPKPKIGQPKANDAAKEANNEKKRLLQDQLHDLLDKTDKLIDKAGN